jgi:hypothetical protein
MIEPNSSDINLSTLGKLTEDDARSMLERMRWPNGPICPHCGVVGEATAMASDTATENKLRAGVWNCRACREPFTVTVGTIFEGSHIPLSRWLVGFYLFASSKKSISALQLQRQLGLGSYRTAWHMAHRIRAAMANGGPQGPLTGNVEVDEVYIGGKPRHKGTGVRGRGTKKTPVAVLVQRDGAARARAVERVDGKTLKAFIRENVAKSATIYSDECNSYTGIGKEFDGGHHVVRHAYPHREYARPGGVHSNTAESFNGLFKRAIQGSWHHISKEHIGRYLDEQVYRWTHREVSDTQRTLTALGRVEGIRLYYRKPKGSEGEAGLVANG